jgi:4-hydroxy-tetrahydrodipicolinate synthase
MGAKKLKEKLYGVIPIVWTPTTQNYDVDYEKYREHVSWLIEKGYKTGSGALLCIAAMGEGPFLSETQYKKCVDLLADVSNGKVPIIVGIFDLNPLNAVEKMKYAEDAGIEFAQVSPPHYSTPSDEEVYTFYKMINERTDMGIIIYNSWWTIPCSMFDDHRWEMTPKLMSKLCELENIVGIKYCGYKAKIFFDMITNEELTKNVVFIDNFGLGIWGPKFGIKAYLSNIANYAPKRELSKFKLLLEGKHEEYLREVERYDKPLENLLAELYTARNTLGEGSYAHAAMEAAGKPFGPPFPPQKPFTEEEISRLRQLMKRANIVEE